MSRVLEEPPVESGSAEGEGLANTQSLANRLRPVLLRLNRSLRAEAHELGVTSTQASLLAVINRNPGIGIGELASRERMGAPTLVGHIDKLERAGLVERARSDANDRRRVDLRLTPEGKRMWDTLIERRTAWLSARLATLSPESLASIEQAIGPLEELVDSKMEVR